MAGKNSPPLDSAALLARLGGASRRPIQYKKKQVVYSQGDAADAVFYIAKGKVKLTVVSAKGKEAVIAILEAGDFLGESCMVAGQRVRMGTATSLEESSIIRIAKSAMIRALHAEPVFSELFMTYLLARKLRIEEDLIDQLFNSSEKRLARILLLMAHFGNDSPERLAVPKISQETLAHMVGTTRSRVSFFMNKFKKLGLIEYNGGLKIKNSLLNVILHD